MKKRSESVFNKKIKLPHFIIVCLVLILATAAATYVIVTGGFGAQKYFEDAKSLVEIEKIIDENYIGDVSRETLYNSAASAMARRCNSRR